MTNTDTECVSEKEREKERKTNRQNYQRKRKGTNMNIEPLSRNQRRRDSEDIITKQDREGHQREEMCT